VSTRQTLLLLVTLPLVLLGSACSGSPVDDGVVIGVVTEVTGDLSGIESFVVLDAGGDSFKFKPRSGLLVMGAPPSHLRDHVVSGEPVTVTYHEDSAGELIADAVTDARH
jgi:hypothetical protein